LKPENNYTVQEAARLLNRTDFTIRRQISEGKLQAHKQGRTWLLPAKQFTNAAAPHVAERHNIDITGTLSDVIQSLNARIDSQGDRIQLLEAENNRLRERLNRVALLGAFGLAGTMLIEPAVNRIIEAGPNIIKN